MSLCHCCHLFQKSYDHQEHHSIILNKLVSARSRDNKKNVLFDSETLTYIISLLFAELLLTFFAEQFFWELSEKVFITPSFFFFFMVLGFDLRASGLLYHLSHSTSPLLHFEG
jgi:hypothetical protein